MDKLNFSTKHLAINKANTQIVIAVSAAAFITVFCLIATKSVFSQYKYQARVINQSNIANDQITADINAYGSLVKAYDKFNNTSKNLLGQPVSGTNNNNAQLVLDSLPGAYDFPGLTSTLENIASANSVTLNAITGSDDQLKQGNIPASNNPTPIVIPFGFSVSNIDIATTQKLLLYLQSSVRPIAVDTLTFSGDQGNLSMQVQAHTFFQPAKKLSITQETVQ